MGRVPATIRNEVGKRDRYLCQECGIRVGRVATRVPGLQFHAHHKVPQSRGGRDTPSNLVTICSICHALKRSRGHRLLFSRLAKRNLGEFVVWFLRDFGLESLAYSERLDPRDLPSENVQQVLETVAGVCRDLAAHFQSSPKRGREHPLPTLADILPGLEIGWRAHITERHLEELLRSDPMS
jgi:HNH endonuclease